MKTLAKSRAVAWAKDDPFGVEFAAIEIGSDRLSATGVAIGTAPVPYRIDYELETGAGFITERLRVTSRGEGWRRELDLGRGSDGRWTAAARAEGAIALPPPGGDTTPLAGAADCDLGLSPVTNMMPLLREGLLDGGGPVELTTAWVAVPALSVHADRQRYRHIGSGEDGCVIRFEAVDGSFAADLLVDTNGVVIDYPGIARRLG